MQTVLILLALFILILLLGAIFYAHLLSRKFIHHQETSLSGLREDLQKNLGDQKADFRDVNSVNFETLRKSVHEALTNQVLILEKRFDSLQQQNDSRLQEIRQNVQRSLKENLDQNFGAFKEMSKSLTALKSSADQMLHISQQVGELNQILSSPKLQGNFGEAALHQLLSDFLPQGAFEWQPRLSDGSQPDAAIRIKDLLLCIDSKFPKDRIADLLSSAKDDSAREAARKEINRVIREMASSIAKKYIKPEIGTADQAFLFVPSESLYYEILRQPELTDYCHKLKVSLASPNTLAATLYAVALAFRGYEMQENAKNLLKSIQEMDKHFQGFRSDFGKIGMRIRQAQEDYDKADRDLNRFDKTMTKLRDGNPSLSIGEE